MRIRIVEGPGAPWSGSVRIDHGAVWLDGEPYCPFDDLRGVVVENAAEAEIAVLAEYGFGLDWLH